MATTITKVFTIASRTIFISNGVLRASVLFKDDKGNIVGQASFSVKDGKVVETGAVTDPKLTEAASVVEAGMSALTDALVRGGVLDPLNRGRWPVPSQGA